MKQKNMKKTLARHGFDYKYIKHLILVSIRTDCEKIATELGMTINCLDLKLRGVSNIYIHEGIKIAHELGLNIDVVFKPSKETRYHVLYEDLNIQEDRALSYRKFNLNRDYISNLLHFKSISIKDIQTLWNVKQATVYVKLRGDSKITLEEGLDLAKLLNMDINDLFCPTKKMINKKLSNMDFVNCKLFDNIDSNKLYLDKEKFMRLLSENGMTLRGLVIAMESPELYYTKLQSKLNGNIRLLPNEAHILCNFLEVELKDILKDDKILIQK